MLLTRKTKRSATTKTISCTEWAEFCSSYGRSVMCTEMMHPFFLPEALSLTDKTFSVSEYETWQQTWWIFNNKKTTTIEDTLLLIFLRMFSPSFKHVDPIILSTFWSCSKVLLLTYSSVFSFTLVAASVSLSDCSDCPSWLLWLWGKVWNPQYQILWVRQMQTHRSHFIWQKLPFQKWCVTQNVDMTKGKTVHFSGLLYLLTLFQGIRERCHCEMTPHA